MFVEKNGGTARSRRRCRVGVRWLPEPIRAWRENERLGPDQEGDRRCHRHDLTGRLSSESARSTGGFAVGKGRAGELRPKAGYFHRGNGALR